MLPVCSVPASTITDNRVYRNFFEMTRLLSKIGCLFDPRMEVVWLTSQ